MQERDKGSYSIQSVENALDVLEALGDAAEEVRISHLSSKLGLNKTSVFRLLATFERRGYVEREQKSGKYRLGISAYEIGQKFLSRMSLLRKAKPVMERLSRECNEAVYLACPRGGEILFLDMVDTPQQVKAITLVGNRFPLSRIAAGKVLLAFRPQGEGSKRRERKQGNDGPTPEISKKERDFIHRHGAFCDRDVLGDGITSLAAPLFNATGEVLGCLVLVGPEFRLNREKMEGEMLTQLKEAAEVISSKLGYVGHYLMQ